MEEKKIFRETSLTRFSSPEQLTDYLKVTNPGMWTVLVALILLLAGAFVWAAVGVLETTMSGTAEVHGGVVTATMDERSGVDEIQAGQVMFVDTVQTTVGGVGRAQTGQVVVRARVNLPDGSYHAEVVTERIHPIKFLIG